MTRSYKGITGGNIGVTRGTKGYKGMTGGYNGLQGGTKGYRDTKLRLSNHKLAIETGRYSRPFKKPAERICPICNIEMEDEYHFLNI